MSTWKALSLWEPWASAIRVGAKTWETRSWPTNYRGDLLICAAKHTNEVLLKTLLEDSLWQQSLRPLRAKPEGLVTRSDLNFGMAVAIVELRDCIQTEALHENRVVRLQQHLGDFSMGRWAWQLENIRPIVPVPVKGRQGLFTVEMSGDLTWQKDPLTGAEIR